MDLEFAKVPQVLCYQCSTQIEVGNYQPFDVVICPKCGMELSVPGRLGNMLLLNPIGTGSMGAVYRARDLTLMRIVAVKVLKDREQGDQKRIEACLREARALAALNHPNVVNVFSIGHELNQPFIVMEFVDGQRLDQMIKSAGKLNPRIALKLAMDITRGLRAAYKGGLIHGDVKPPNTLVTRKAVAKLVDFGIARPLEGEMKDKIFGTPYYVAPELVRREKFDHRCDMFSLGATLFEALTGRPPFKGQSVKHTIHMRLSKAAPNVRQLVPTLSAETAGVVARMLQNDPQRRYQTYDDLIQALHSAWTAARKDPKSGIKASKSVKAGRKSPSAPPPTPLPAPAKALPTASGLQADQASAGSNGSKLQSGADPNSISGSGSGSGSRSGGGIKAFNPDQMMAAFRRSCRGVRLMTRDDLIRTAASHLGVQELNQENWANLNKQLNAARRRKIIAIEGEEIRLATPSFKDYETEYLVKTIKSVMRKGYEYERDVVARSVAAYLGFSNMTRTMREGMKPAFNSAIRQNMIAYKGKWVWRTD